jgi:hypothetical protein
MTRVIFNVKCMIFAVFALMWSMESFDNAQAADDSSGSSAAAASSGRNKMQNSKISSKIKRDFLQQDSFNVINPERINNIFQQNLSSQKIYDNLYELSEECFKLVDEETTDFAAEEAQKLFTEEYISQLIKNNEEKRYEKISNLSRDIKTFADNFLNSSKSGKNKTETAEDEENDDEEEGKAIDHEKIRFKSRLERRFS